MRSAITAKERLVVTLRYLATGDSFKSLTYMFRIPQCTTSGFIPEVCNAIYITMKDEYLQTPHTEDQWNRIANNFNEKWNFPNCIGALDGKHINIKAPKNSGSLYFNYKSAHSIVLMALVDANYQFTYINIGAPGRDSDGGIFNGCNLFNAINNKKIQLPKPKPLPNRNVPVPFVIVADDAFALSENLLKPYPFKSLTITERIFNYRLSRNRRISENAFGIASARFRVLRKNIDLQPEKVKVLVSAICVLHNFILCKSKKIYAPFGTFDCENENGTVIPGNWRNESQHFINLQPNQTKNSTVAAKQTRNEFKNSFSEEGEVPWQGKFI